MLYHQRKPSMRKLCFLCPSEMWKKLLLTTFCSDASVQIFIKNEYLLPFLLFSETCFCFLPRFLSFLRLQEAGNQKFDLQDSKGVEQVNLLRLPALSSLRNFKNEG